MRFVAATIATGLLLGILCPEVGAYPLTLEQRERFKQYIPRTFPKLEARDPVHVVLLGDSVTAGHTPLPGAWEDNNPLFSYSGVFLSKLAREFFYQGGVSLLNPPEGGTARRSEYLGATITLETLIHSDANSLDGLRHATSDAFLHNPDLIVIQYGIYDAFGRVSIDTYKRALQEAIDLARRSTVDVIIMGPGLTRFGEGDIPWGLERPYASAAREVAVSNRVLFLDTGKYLGKFGGGVDPETEPAAAMEIVSDRLSRIFYFGPELKVPERIHTSFEANDFLGESLFEDLKNGPPASRFHFAGVAQFEKDGLVTTTIAIRNLTKERQVGTIGALAVGMALQPLSSSQRFSVPAEQTTQVSFSYKRPIIGKARDGSDVLFPLEPTDEFARFSYLVEDSVHSEVVDLPLRLGPVTAVWKSRKFLNVTDRMRVEWDLVNGSDKAIAGTFQVGMGDKVGQPTDFSASPLGTKTVFSLFEFEGGDANCFQQDVWIQTEVDGVVTRFTREMEACRDLVLGEETSLLSWDEYINAAPAGDGRAKARPRGGAIRARFDADEEALYVVADIQGIRIPDLGDRAALRARLFLDARPANEVLTFGSIHPVEVYTKGSDGPGYTPDVRIGSFGNGYNMVLSPKGIGSALTTSDDGSRSLQIRIPRSYLHRHEWKLGEVDSLLGIRLEITIGAPDANAADPFPIANSFVTSGSTIAYADRTIHGFSEKDARSLTTLRLSRQPVGSWSVRIY